jgi:tRNA-splicing ligase RtcB (3'-phosphate/5'-hydroxy nucleic acid ligase)
MPIKQVVYEEDFRTPVKVWTEDIEVAALNQAKNLARLPFIHKNGVALMPDVHAGIGSTVGSIIASERAVIPAAVGVDIGCGMNAVRTSLRAEALPDSLLDVRLQIERDVPLGAGGAHAEYQHRMSTHSTNLLAQILLKNPGLAKNGVDKALSQMGTLGSGNHFIELCLDEEGAVWIMLHSGSRGIGNMIGRYFIERARRLMEQWFITLPDRDLAYLPDGTQDFSDYITAIGWAQDYARENRAAMMTAVISALRRHISVEFELTTEAVNCHHNYLEIENHFGTNMYITRKGAIRARQGDFGIIPGSMGARSYIVRGKGNAESYCSCPHGAGRRMSRTEATKRFTVEDLKQQTEGVECNKTSAVVDEIPGAYKDIDQVMANSSDLVEVVHVLKQVLCVKGI